MSRNFFEARMAQRSGDSAFPISGKIRVGTKAISKKAAAIPGAAKLFQDALDGKVSFQAAEKQISEQFQVRNPFYPRNTQEFHAHAWDMGAGGKAISDKLMALYGESVNGGPVKLYRFPIVFPDVGGDVDAIIEGRMAVQGGGPNIVRYWSEFNEHGLQVCRHLPEVKKSDMAQRRAGKPIRHPERQAVTRGYCVPQKCNEFAMGMCRFSGKIRFYIPGIPGAGLFELHTGSTPAATEIYQRIMQALRALNGKLRNYTPDGRPIFWLTKKKAVRQYFDEEGNPKKGEQWVPEIEMEIEMPRVIMLQEMRGEEPQGLKPVAGLAATPSAWNQQSQEVNRATSEADDDGTGEQFHGGDFEHLRERAPDDEDACKPAAVEDAKVREATPVAKSGDGASASPAGGQDTISQMQSHAERLGYVEELGRWVQVKHGGDFAAAHKAWMSLSERFSARLKDYLSLSLLIHDQGLNSDLVMKYLKLRYGPVGAGAKLAEMLAHVKDLCNDGASVATSVMEELLDDATA
ncbi:recombination directionality factor [Hydrogenophaga sp. NFH-34]|uniref:recombination directionality factor n=1 Tax=Hydrogenophaga sp. NFH-34 TaxID=2744446 RepID=UPI001F1DCBBE|nr:hypothetical protein [Hydrogenophaga sp. NFH-34]